jgi:hypothetical protein
MFLWRYTERIIDLKCSDKLRPGHILLYESHQRDCTHSMVETSRDRDIGSNSLCYVEI